MDRMLKQERIDLAITKWAALIVFGPKQGWT